MRDLDRRMRSLERGAYQVAGRAQAGAMQATEQVSDAVASALADFFGRFRGVRGDAARFGQEAARFGNDALRRLSNEVEHRPLATLAVAAGIGLLIGLAGRRG